MLKNIFLSVFMASVIFSVNAMDRGEEVVTSGRSKYLKSRRKKSVLKKKDVCDVSHNSNSIVVSFYRDLKDSDYALTITMIKHLDCFTDPFEIDAQIWSLGAPICEINIEEEDPLLVALRGKIEEFEESM